MQVIPSGSTTSHIVFVMMSSGTPVAGATITGVSYKKGTGSLTAMTTPTTGHAGSGLHYLVADEDTTISSGLVHETMTFIITASDADTAFVTAVIEAPQLGASDVLQPGQAYNVAVDPGTGSEALGSITLSTP